MCIRFATVRVCNGGNRECNSFINHSMIAQLEHLTEVYLVQNGESILVDQFFGLTRALDLNADRMAVELTFVKQAVDNAVRKEGISITEGEERLDFDYLEPLGRLVSQAKNSKIMAK